MERSVAISGNVKAGVPRVLELRELVPAAIQGDRAAFIKALKIGAYVHARTELKLSRRDALELLGVIPWENVTYRVTFVNGEAANG
jgi:hypothetical protein